MMIVIAPQRLHYNMLIRKNMKGRDENKDEEAEESRKVAARRRNPQRRDKKLRTLFMSRSVRGRGRAKRGAGKKKNERKNRYLPSAGVW